MNPAEWLPGMERFSLNGVAPLARIILILAGAAVVAALARRLITALRFRIVRLVKLQQSINEIELEKRAATISGALRTVTAVLIYALAAGLALRQMGLDVGPLIAGAGVAGIAIGLGAQNLFRDVISGFFMLIEDQIRVNDVAIINGTSGVVEELNLRTTVLRDGEGVVHIFSNGAITSLANRTREYSYYMFTFGLAFESDTDGAVEAMKEVDVAMRQEAAFAGTIQAPLEIWGVDQFVDTGVVIKARIRTAPGRQWEVGREMNRRIKRRFDEKGILLMARWARQPAHAGWSKEELKEAVREVLAESGGRQGDGRG